MILKAAHIIPIPASKLDIFYKGKLLKNVTSLNLETGECLTLKLKEEDGICIQYSSAYLDLDQVEVLLHHRRA
jgi:hypothetical protein